MKPRANHFSIPLLSLLLAGLFLLAGATLPGRSFAQEQGLETLRQSGQAFRAVAKQVSPAVVFIKVEQTTEGQDQQQYLSPFDGPFGDEFFRRFFGTPPESHGQKHPPQKRHAQGQGSGFIISADGLIMTNNHVVADADKITVRLLDGREFEAKTIGTDPATDVAVIQIEAKGLPYLKLGNSDQLEVGDWVLAVGNPFGLSHTLTAGIVSAKGRSGMGLSDYENFIQTDAAINPGNSGGPLVNLDGEVVGMNSAIFSRSGGYMGIGFAIPINMAKQIRDQLVEHGKVTRGQLGVYIQELTKDLADSFGLESTQGALVSRVMEDSAAEKAGLKQGDIILRINGKPVGKVSDFRNQIAMTPPDTKVSLDILRDGKEQQVKVTIGTLATDKSGRPTDSESLEELGMKLQPLTPDLAERLGYQGESGALVANVDPDSPAARAGIERGDLIQEVNRSAVTSPEEVRAEIKKGKGKPVLLLVRHGEATRYLALKPE